MEDLQRLKKNAEFITKVQQSDEEYEKKRAEIDSRTYLEYINPFTGDFDAYASFQIKKTTSGASFNKSLKPPIPGLSGTIVIGGAQFGYTNENNEGWYGNFVTMDKSYVNYKIGDLAEVRIIPGSGNLTIPIGGNLRYGDFRPSFRVLTTVYTNKAIAIQADLMMNRNSVQFGGRVKAETQKIGGYSLEAAAGIRGTLKMPQLFKDIAREFE